MSKLKLICAATTIVMALTCFSTTIRAQNQPKETDAGRISETVRTASYPEAIYPHGVMPDWDRGYVMHYEIEVNYSPETPMVVMYDNSGKRIREGRIWPQGASSVRIRRTAATPDGAILAAGWAVMQDGSTQGYIAKTDLGGTTVQTVVTGTFKPEQICEAPDGTIWSLGQSASPSDGEEPNTDVLRHFSFEKGLQHSFLPRETVKAVSRSDSPWFSPFGSYVRCGKDKVSVYLKFTDEYVEVDTSSFELKRWMLDESAVQHEKAGGLAIKEDGKVYGYFSAHATARAEGLNGLYQIKAKSGSSIAELIPVAGSTSFQDGKKPPPSGTVIGLWGADGNQLVVWRVDERDISWVDVIGGEAKD